ncbi:hypothetical protein BGW36DRAFT_362349 [Talaromyces proteolyticus]|uniref:Uncharacterized protein n=1 Tax=Talaromyces proteolyticus TaxID=1131652 RepID=A0AAD4KPR5_9EURO|nr:uncharacterized protein BGW36DRAFT_362349 [Talaromyces proteolyticus]KAH8692799.1 hypothetical protein BGW36DRAFT_362349 [Talaromyces proteolyticus]
MLQDIGGLVEDDLLFLMPSEDGDGHAPKGFVTCFLNGFNTSKKLNLKLRDIHKPVPQYKERLEKNMDGFFDKLKVGNVVKRANVWLANLQWTIQNTDRPFISFENHLYEGEDTP